MTPSDLKAARRRLGLSIRELATAVGATPRTVRRWQAGSLPIPPRVAEQIEAELGALLFV